MTDTCTYSGDRDATLIAYLYDDIDPVERATFARHLGACMACRRELSALGGVREMLGRWAPPEPGFTRIPLGAPSAERSQRAGPHRRGWRDIPAWAQAAAAILIVGASAGLANLDVRYDAQGLSVRTGWSKPVVNQPAPSVDRAAAAATVSITREDLAALEQKLRQEFATTTASAPLHAGTDSDVLRRVRAMLDESEKRQQRELALRVAEVMQDVRSQRASDLRRIDASLNGFQNSLGVEVLKQRRSLNYLMSVSQKP